MAVVGRRWERSTVRRRCGTSSCVGVHHWRLLLLLWRLLFFHREVTLRSWSGLCGIRLRVAHLMMVMHLVVMVHVGLRRLRGKLRLGREVATAGLWWGCLLLRRERAVVRSSARAAVRTVRLRRVVDVPIHTLLVRRRVHVGRDSTTAIPALRGIVPLVLLVLMVVVVMVWGRHPAILRPHIAVECTVICIVWVALRVRCPWLRLGHHATLLLLRGVLLLIVRRGIRRRSVERPSTASLGHRGAVVRGRGRGRIHC